MSSSTSADQKLARAGQALFALVGTGNFTFQDANHHMTTITDLVKRGSGGTTEARQAISDARDDQGRDHPSVFRAPVIHPMSRQLQEKVFCPFIVTYGGQGGRPGCRCSGDHGFFSHDTRIQPKDALECPWWHEGNCQWPEGQCLFAHHRTVHGQVARKPRTQPQA